MALPGGTASAFRFRDSPIAGIAGSEIESHPCQMIPRQPFCDFGDSLSPISLLKRNGEKEIFKYHLSLNSLLYLKSHIPNASTSFVDRFTRNDLIEELLGSGPSMGSGQCDPSYRRSTCRSFRPPQISCYENGGTGPETIQLTIHSGRATRATEDPPVDRFARNDLTDNPLGSGDPSYRKATAYKSFLLERFK